MKGGGARLVRASTGVWPSQQRLSFTALPAMGPTLERLQEMS